MLIKGCLRFDGCLDWDLGKPPMGHFCSLSEAGRMGEVFRWVYTMGRKNLIIGHLLDRLEE